MSGGVPAFEGFREPEPIAASHLLRVGCSICGPEVSALAAPGRERTARCTGCLGGSRSVPAGSMPYTVPVGYPGIRSSVSVDLSGREPYPNPVVSSRDGAMGDAPGAVSTLAADAMRLGWKARVQYARGRFPHGGTGAPTMERESFAVLMRRERPSGAWGAYAVYAGDTWRSVMMWGAALPWFPLASVTDLREWLADPGRGSEWYDAIRERVHLAEVRKKLRAKCDKGQHAEAAPLLDLPGPVRVVYCTLCSHGWLFRTDPWRKPRGKGEAAL